MSGTGSMRPRTSREVSTPSASRASQDGSERDDAVSPHKKLESVLFPRLYSPKVSPYLMIIAVTGSTIIQTYFSGALTIALPTIGDQLGFGGEDLQWPLTMYSLLNGAFLLICGALADAYGRRTFFFAGILWLMVMSLAITFVESSVGFIALSAALGLGCAILAPASTGLLSMLPEGNLRNTSYACLGAGQPTGYLLGIFAGGFLSKNWHIIMYIMTGCCFIFAVLAVVSLPADVPSQFSQDNSGGIVAVDPHTTKIGRLMTFDWIGAFLSTVGLILLTFALADAGSSSKGWKSPFVPAMLPLAALCLLSFGLWEYRAERRSLARRSKMNPLLPTSIWKVPTFTPLLFMVFFAWANFNTVTYFSTLYMQVVQELSPIQAAIRFVPMVISGIVYNVFTGLVMARLHGVILIALGCIGASVACVFYCILSPTTNYWSALFIVFLLSPATDLLFPVAQLHACNCVGPKKAALAGGMFNTVTRLASSLGLAITATISSAVTKEYSKHHPIVSGRAAGSSSTSASSDGYSAVALLKGYQAAVWFCFSLSVVALIIALIWLRGIGVVGAKQPENIDKDKAVPGEEQQRSEDLSRHSMHGSTSHQIPRDVKKSLSDDPIANEARPSTSAAVVATSASTEPGGSSAALALAVNDHHHHHDHDHDHSQQETDSTYGLTLAAATPGACTPSALQSDTQRDIGQADISEIGSRRDAYELKEL
ncbi:unnamed protein product [Sympodiomycopsis kandeliae]